MFFDAIKESNAGKGVAILYGNYAGDNMNVSMAMEEVEEEGIEVKRVVAKINSSAIFYFHSIVFLYSQGNLNFNVDKRSDTGP